MIDELPVDDRARHWKQMDLDCFLLAVAAIEYVVAMEDYEKSQKQL